MEEETIYPPRFEYYQHNDYWTWVRTEDKGKHREHCLCWSCENFTPDNRDTNCRIANILFVLDRAFELVTPVWECPEFVEKIT